jgi:hypothetical protein
MITEKELHLEKAIHNLKVLQHLEIHNSPYRDWQVTVCFYVALHLTRLHLWDKIGQGYESHQTAEHALEPTNLLSLARMEPKPFADYMKLSMLSRKARYLFDGGVPCSINEKSYCDSLRFLDSVMRYFAGKHGLELPVTPVKCPKLLEFRLVYFRHEV